MPKFVIERNMPGAGALSRDDLAATAREARQAKEHNVAKESGIY
jgi:hypothetical protein